MHLYRLLSPSTERERERSDKSANAAPETTIGKRQEIWSEWNPLYIYISSSWSWSWSWRKDNEEGHYWNLELGMWQCSIGDSSPPRGRRGVDHRTTWLPHVSVTEISCLNRISPVPPNRWPPRRQSGDCGKLRPKWTRVWPVLICSILFFYNGEVRALDIMHVNKIFFFFPSFAFFNG